MKTINEIIKGKASITPETALQFEHVLNYPASFWNNLERQYQETLARLEEEKKLMAHVDWLKHFPIKEMTKLGWIGKLSNKVQQLRELLNFLGIASPEQFSEIKARLCPTFRQSVAHTVNEYAVIAWLRQGELEARKITTEKYDPSIFQEALHEIRLLTREKTDKLCRGIRERCATAGIAVVFVPELSKTRVHGATRWLTPEKPLIQLSLFYKTNDQFWFSFFHEAAHVLFHGKRKTFVEIGGDGDHPLIDSAEVEANRFAEDLLIPRADFKPFLEAGRFGPQEVERFAEQIGIHPGIVVGRLQHETKNFKLLNHLKVRFRWAPTEEGSRRQE